MAKKILIVLVAISSISTGYFWHKSQEVQISQSDVDNRGQKCLSWSTYSPTSKAWHWRAETFGEYFPSKEDAVLNCIATLNDVLNPTKED